MTALANPVNVTGAGAVFAGPCSYRGMSVRDTSGATNTVKLYDSPNAASGTVIATFQLAANASALDQAPDGVRAATGLYFSSTGAVEGSVRVG